MRTIKFRGLEANPYCEELRTFLYGTPLFITNEENYILPNFWDYEGLNKFKVLKKTISQFTGLHDKNGKEIYEKMELNNTFIIKWLNFRYVLFYISDLTIFEEIFDYENKLEITGEYTEL